MCLEEGEDVDQQCYYEFGGDLYLWIFFEIVVVGVRVEGDEIGGCQCYVWFFVVVVFLVGFQVVIDMYFGGWIIVFFDVVIVVVVGVVSGVGIVEFVYLVVVGVVVVVQFFLMVVVIGFDVQQFEGVGG